VAAGLAGGSADAAAVIKGMNELFNLNADEAELMDIGKQVERMCLSASRENHALRRNREKLTKIPSFEGVNIVLVKPKVGVSTAWVYSNLKLNEISSRPDTELLIKAIYEKILAVWRKT